MQAGASRVDQTGFFSMARSIDLVGKFLAVIWDGMEGDVSCVSVGRCECIEEREKAILVTECETGKNFWIPKSVLGDDSEVWKLDQIGDVVVKEWWYDNSAFG